MEGDKKIWQNKDFFVGMLIGLTIVLIAVFATAMVSDRFISKVDFNTGDDSVNGTIAIESGPETESVTNPAINTFELKKDASICAEDGKPVIYLFTASWCKHCGWIKDTFDRVVLEYEKAGKIKAYHIDLESGDNLLTAEIESQLSPNAMAVYQEFNPEDAIPAFVFGCKYFRIGNGYEMEDDLEAEEKEFREAIDDILKS